MTRHEYRSLMDRLARTLEDRAVLVDRIETSIDKAERRDDEAQLHAAALDLHGFYAGAEQAFEAIARNVDGNLPQGTGWHRELLLGMATAVPRVRPAVAARDTEACLDAYRGFGEVIRNTGTIDLDPQRIRDLGADVRGCLARLIERVFDRMIDNDSRTRYTHTHE